MTNELPDAPKAGHRAAHGLFALWLALWMGFVFGVASDPPAPGLGHDEFVMVYGHLNVVNYTKADLPIVDSPLNTSMRKPHLPFLVSSLVFRAWHGGYAALLIANALFALLWWTAVYRVGTRVFDPWTALAAVCVMGGFHLTHHLIEHYGNDIPLALFAALGIALLLEPKEFSGGWRWPALGLVVGLGLLSKPTLPVYIAGPVLLLVLRIGQIAAGARRPGYLAASIFGMVLTVGILGAVWLPWFARVWDVLRTHLDFVAGGPGRDFAWFHSIDGDTAAGDLVKYLGWPGALFIAFGLGCIPFAYKGFGRRTLLAALLPPLVVFIAEAEAFTRLMFPLWFIAVLFGVERLRRLPNTQVARAATVAAAVFFTSMMMGDHAGTPWQPWPERNARSASYWAGELADRLDKELTGPSDVLFINQVDSTEGPRFYLDALELQCAPHVRYLHIWDARQTDPGNSIVNDLLPRWGELRAAVIRRPASVPSAPGDAIPDALQRSWELQLPGFREQNPVDAVALPTWRLRFTIHDPPGNAGVDYDVYGTDSP